MSMDLTLVRVLIILNKRILYHIKEASECDNVYEQQEHQNAIAELDKVLGMVSDLGTEDYRTDGG